jgi:DNA-binding transcriptional MocR family regulator
MAPGLRLGWIQASRSLVDRTLKTGVVNSGGSFNHFTSQIMRHAIDLGLQQSMLDKLRASYHRRLETMETALQGEFADKARWHKPDGGYFFWLELDQKVDAGALKAKAMKNGVGFQPGEIFSCNENFKNYIRLSFAHYRRDQIKEGISRLSSLIA